MFITNIRFLSPYPTLKLIRSLLHFHLKLNHSAWTITHVELIFFFIQDTIMYIIVASLLLQKIKSLNLFSPATRVQISSRFVDNVVSYCDINLRYLNTTVQ